MSADGLLLSEKYKAFLRCNAPVEFLEGTTAAGKTTVGLFKFMLKVAESPKKLHSLAAKDTGTAEKNIINKDLGMIDDFGILTEYNGNGTKVEKIPHILFHTSAGDKIIYVMGYGDKKKWQKALGGQSLDGLPQGGPADPQLLSQLQLVGELLPGRELLFHRNHAVKPLCGLLR